MKDSTQAMNILEAYDLYQSYNQAARECHCSPNTVKALVQARKDGTLAARGRRQSTSSIFNADELSLITELVEASEGFIRADVIHRRLQGIGYKESGRSTRRAVRKEKTKYRRAHARVYWPWIPEPGKWAQYDFSDGPVIDGEKTTLFHYYLPYSKYRIVLYIPDQSLPNVIGALHTCFAMTGGVPHYVLTDNAKTAASAHIANVAVLNAKMVKFASAYGFALQTCIPYDPASKGGVERAVRVAKEHLCPTDANLVANYESIAQLKDAIDAFNIEINAKVHSGTGKVPALVLPEEKAVFSSLPQSPYVGAYGVMRRVEANMGIVHYRHCGYSVDPSLRGSCVYVREVDDEVVIVTVTGSGVTEVARHKRGEPYGYVISDQHKNPSHPSGPLLRHPIPTNETEGKFLSIIAEAGTWLERAGALGTKRIPDTISLMVKASSERAGAAIVESLALGDFSYTTMKALLAKAHQVTPAPAAREVESLGNSTLPYAKLKAVSACR